MYVPILIDVSYQWSVQTAVAVERRLAALLKFSKRTLADVGVTTSVEDTLDEIKTCIRRTPEVARSLRDLCINMNLIYGSTP